MLVTAVSTNELTVTRGTSPGTHADGAKVYRLTESTLDGALTDSATNRKRGLEHWLVLARPRFVHPDRQRSPIGDQREHERSDRNPSATRNDCRGSPGWGKSIPLEGHVGPHLEIDSTYVSGVEVVAPRSIDEANAIGDGCKSLGFCTGKGECDHCTSTCRCPHAHSAVDNSYTSYSCEAINCPTGMALGRSAVAPGGAGDNTWAHYRRLPKTRGRARASARRPANAVASRTSSARRASGGSAPAGAPRRATARATARARR